LGIVPKALTERDIIGKTIGEELLVSIISDQMNAMFNHKPIGLLNVNGFYDNLLSFLDQVVEQEFLTSSARQIIIFVATAEQLIDQLQSFIPVLDPSMSRINWSIMESCKKLRLDLSLYL